jgi:hypothetical protein
VVAVLLGHLLRLPVAAMGLIVTSGMTQVDASCEGDVALGIARVPNHHEFLVMGTAEAHPLIEQHLAARGFDRLPEMLVLLLAVGELVQMRAPHQALDHDAALGRVAEQLPDGRSVVAHLLVGVPAPIGEEEIVPVAEHLDFTDQPVEVGRTMDQRLGAATCTPGGNRGARVASLLRSEKPIRELRHANRVAEGEHE